MRSGYVVLFTLTLWLITDCQFMCMSEGKVTTAYLELIEEIAHDASIGQNSTVWNSWGGHQSKMTRHSDGCIRIMYIQPYYDPTYSYLTSTALNWVLMRKDPLTGAWSQEATARTLDDAHLLRDARDDRAYIVAYPNSIATVYASPLYQPVTIPGPWQILTPAARHYGNAGIGPDGTLCLKNSREANLTPTTSITNTEYVCGIYNSTSDQWNWSPYITHPIGQRYAYDYLYPNPRGFPAGLYGFSNRDAYKLAERLPNLSGNYVFDGMRGYVTGITSDDEFRSWDLLAPIPFPNLQQTTAPTQRMQDLLLDSQGRIWTVYYVDTPSYARYIQVSDMYGHVYGQVQGSFVGTGGSRLFEDVKGRIWHLWTLQSPNPGTQSYLYQITESGTKSNPIFTQGPLLNLNSWWVPYAIDGNAYLATQRGGSDLGLNYPYLDVMLNACNSTVTPFVTANCYQFPSLGPYTTTPVCQ